MIGPILNSHVFSIKEVTKNSALLVRKPKRAIEINLNENDKDTKEIMELFDAGDSFYFIFPNSSYEVDFILKRWEIFYVFLNFRLNVFEMADQQINIKNNYEEDLIPSYIPNPTSIRYVLTYCLDIRRSPGRVGNYFNICIYLAYYTCFSWIY